MTILNESRIAGRDLRYATKRWSEQALRPTRFPMLDTFEGNVVDPQSLHKYLYAHADPVNLIDPSGRAVSVSTLGGLAIGTSLQTIGAGAVIGAVISETFYFTTTEAAEWSITGALTSMAKGAVGGAFGSTLIGGAWFAIQGVYQGIQVWRDPRATGLQKALASVNVTLSVLSAWFLKGQVRSQWNEWKNVYSKIPLGVEVQRDLGAIRAAFEAGEESMTIGGRTIQFIERPGQAGGVFAGVDDWFYLTPDAFTSGDDFLMRAIIEENVHLYRMKAGQGLAGLTERGVGHAATVAPEEQIVGEISDDIFRIGRERNWW